MGPLQFQMSARRLFAESTGDAGKWPANEWHELLKDFLTASTHPTNLWESISTDSILDGQHLLVVLHIKVYRILWYALLHIEEQDGARVHAARHPPRLHAVLRLDGIEIRARCVILIYSHPLLSPFAFNLWGWWHGEDRLLSTYYLFIRRAVTS